MNIINKQPLSHLGFGFVNEKFLPKGENEYYLRNLQNPAAMQYRPLTMTEVDILVRNRNVADDWDNILVAEGFDATRVRNCNFYGLVRIGCLESYYVEYNNLRMPVGLYNSTIISCDIGDNVVIDNVNYLSHYIIDKEVMLVNVNEIAATDHSKFGNGIIKDGEEEDVRIWMELCNENGGRKVLPFNGMLAGDAYLWTTYRDDARLLHKFIAFTNERGSNKRGYYGYIGTRTVIKNCKIIKDVEVGTDAYIKGANKIKNCTINSTAHASTQIGEGCELVNGIIGEGCRIFYGVKAVRFVMGSFSQLKYGARLINSYLGDNSTISCCEVLNSLIFPAHEQHHNNSFLCAALYNGQTNMAAGATIGSNHNSRSADGEMKAGRGFWPGLCVSVKYNSRFASYILMAKGDFPAELDIPIPFSLVVNDVSKDKLVVMPGYWFLYNMYGLVRNAAKYDARDKRIDKRLIYEYDYLAPDTVNEIWNAIKILEIAVGNAIPKNGKKLVSEKAAQNWGRYILENNLPVEETITVTTFEYSNRITQLIKVPQAYEWYKKMILYYGASQMLQLLETGGLALIKKQATKRNKVQRTQWVNVGGQLMQQNSVQELLNKIKIGSVKSWNSVHDFYYKMADSYPADKASHAWASLVELGALSSQGITVQDLKSLLATAVKIKEEIFNAIYTSREKDYTNPFRTMMYSSLKEMEQVTGHLNNNPFIIQQQNELAAFKKRVKKIINAFGK